MSNSSVGVLLQTQRDIPFLLLDLMKLTSMVAGPQISTNIVEYEELLDPNDDTDNHTGDKHHEQTDSWQKFFKDVSSLVSTMEELGNPFLERSKDLLTLDTLEIMPKGVVESISQLRTKGAEQYKAFIENRLEINDTAICSTTPRNSFPLFSRPNKEGKSVKIAHAIPVIHRRKFRCQFGQVSLFHMN